MGTVIDITSARSLGSSSDQEREMSHYKLVMKTIEKFAEAANLTARKLDIQLQRHFVLESDRLGDGVIVVIRPCAERRHELQDANLGDYTVLRYHELYLVVVKEDKLREVYVCTLAELDRPSGVALRHLEAAYRVVLQGGCTHDAGTVISFVKDQALLRPTSA